VEGHANHLPVTRGGKWPSNWELSAYRATTVLTYLAGDGVPEPRMYAAGYGSTQPLVPESDPTAITVNRRVDIVVLSNASAEANALLPGIDAAHRGVTP
jgi:chemotaxis protein MotB